MIEMQRARKSRRVDKRLERLVCSGLRPEGNLEKYALELRTQADRLDEKGLIDREGRLLKALANETRLKMLKLLGVREMCVCELTVALDLTQPTASHHLNILENLGLVKDRKEGKWVFYSVARPDLVGRLFEFLESSM